ncbi:phosphoribosyl-AMP cyclohydrolase [Ignicoccus islandicus DSM 13165]|uniref:phosphoribosyl-AMP cyclohydrolase n=2 Tax=Ignicoccus islandicus TaxID=54259 RepID=A0A0U3FMZ1_9CREN|nr:phosphoribosyl-AMP cyclohydrolase [Ignicoccus islandicus DSM 13165]
MMKLSKEKAEEIASTLNYRWPDETVVAVAQEYLSGKVLMVASMNKEAVIRTLTTGVVHYWSKSRKELWIKGATSGHIQVLEKFYIDCDRDSVLLIVRQASLKACHEGYHSCFHYEVKEDGIQVNDQIHYKE